MNIPPSYARIEAALEGVGLLARGGFHPVEADGVPLLANGATVGTLVLAGNVGSSMWAAFNAGRRVEPDPLDAWSRRVLEALGLELGVEALFPFGPQPFLPFQRWARRAEAVYPSPIGPLIHPRWGLWHAYRGALAFAARLDDIPRPVYAFSPCDRCERTPCLTACPVEAASPFDAAACAKHVSGPAGADCRQRGCRARHACPIGNAFAYAPDQARFHMEAFLARPASES